MKSKKKKDIKLLDKLVSDEVLKTKKQCEKCGRLSTQVHHFFSRRYLNTRWDEDNLIAVCFGCHMHFFHSKHEEARDWMVKRLGEEKFNALKARALMKSKNDLQAIALWWGQK